MNKTFQKIVGGVLAVTALMGLSACGSKTEDTKAEGKTYKVGIVQFVDDASLNQIEAAIETELDAKAAELGVTFDYTLYNGQADATTLNQIGAELVSKGVDLIVPIATPAVKIMQSATEDTEIPIVFSAVSDPVGAGIVDALDAPGGRITGTSDALNTKGLLDLMLAQNPDTKTVGLLYILDEPSIGLHQKDNEKLLQTLRHLTDIGNTLIVVEHDEDTMYAADHIADIGPGAGIYGGELVAQGSVQDIMRCEESLTGQYLSGAKKIYVPDERRPGNGSSIIVKGAREHNLKNIDVEFPLGKFVCVTGVSGSGKSSLVNEILYKGAARVTNRLQEVPGEYDEILGMEHIDKVIDIDQSPIGRTPRSNPATYTGMFNHIRDLFASLPEAKLRGYEKGRFSFNVKGGRCEACGGDGIIQIEMHFLPDVYVPCEVCKGKRYNRETLEVKYKGKSIFDVLDMSVSEGVEFFQNIPSISRHLVTLEEVGLGYIKLGQPSTQLSGGEAQRVKLASELAKRSTGKTLYILDEPTTGLHFADVDKLLAVLDKLVDAGNTVVVIEHNLDVIKRADHIIDLGPDGGSRGGTIVTTGTPEEVAACPQSYTGQFLKKLLQK